MTNRKAHKNSPHSALFKPSGYHSIVSYGLIILVFNFSDIKLVKIILNDLLFAIYTRKD